MNKIEIFIYKIFYVLFQHYSKFKGTIQWFSATIAICASFAGLNTSIFWATGLLSPLTELVSLPGSSSRISSLTFAIITILLYYRVVNYILFEKMKISKEDGKSPYYEFTPVRKDRVLTVLYLAGAMFSPVYLIGLRILLFE